MSADAIIKVENLGKRYRLGAGRSNERYTAPRDAMAQKAAAPFRALKVKLERRKEKTNGELTAALRPPPSDSELSPCNLPTFKPSHSTPEDRRQIDPAENSEAESPIRPKRGLMSKRPASSSLALPLPGPRPLQRELFSAYSNR